MRKENVASRNGASHQRICAVIVTYNIGKSVLKVIEAVLEQVDACVVVDNASSDNTLECLQDFVRSNPCCIVIQHGVNNLAKGQNIGIRHALNQQYDWVMLLDHDSVVGDDMVSQMLMVYENHPHQSHVGILAPNLTDRFSKRSAKYVRHVKRAFFYRRGFGDRPYLNNVMVAIASGSLIPADVLREAGLMDESLCIDKVDYDFSLRVLRLGKKIVAVRDAMLNHQLGRCRDNYILGARVTTSNHAPRRRYYIYRNRLLLWRKHGFAVPAYIVFDCCAISYDLAKITLFEANKSSKYRAILAGVRDAFKGEAGAVDFLPGTIVSPKRAT